MCSIHPAKLHPAMLIIRINSLVQVLWLGRPECNATWEPACSLPQKVVDDYETGVAREIELDTTSLYGHVCNTVTMSGKTLERSEPKKKKTERPSYNDLEGYAHLSMICSVVIVAT